MEEIAEGIANRDKVRIASTGAYAMILLGLSSQMPSDIVFVTDGSSRKVSLGKGKSIMFKHTSEMRTFAYRSRLMLLIVMALREIGERNVTEQQMNIIKCHLKKFQQTISRRTSCWLPSGFVKIADTMNYQDIERIAELEEGSNLEFKESTGQLDRSMETLCAFLNGDGGNILYGVKDNGKL